MKLLLSKLKLFILVLFSISSITKIHATHIVGGELTYRCLSHNDQYEITLIVYRDCIHAKAEFDSPACVAVYSNNTGILYKTLKMLYKPELGNPDTLGSIPCIFTDEPVCVEKYVYKDTLSLPLNNAGYLITYQRCCRNETLKNILDPLKTGTTFYVLISTEALKDCNSSPVFNSLPPNFVCMNEALDIDQSATDANGDSLVYKLCTPLKGGLYINYPKPCPPLFSPYDPVSWSAPYSETNMLGNNNPLKIDPVTGIITGIPDSIGQYLVGVCVEEYRNGIFYSSIRRDFEYNVVPCVNIKSDWVFKSECGSLKAELINKSIMSNSFNWNYVDLYKGNSVDSLFKIGSDTIPFFYSFPDTGTYKVCLEASFLNSNCKHDTLCMILKLDALLQFDELSDDTVNICKNKLVFLNPDTIASYKYSWINITDQVNLESVANPKVTATKTTMYQMIYWDPKSSCPPDTQKMVVNVTRELDTLNFKIKINNCCNTIRVEAIDINVNLPQGYGPLKWNWTLITPYGNQISNDSIPLFTPIIKTSKTEEIISIQVKAFTPDSCIFIGYQTQIIKPYVLLNGPLNHHYKICQGDTIHLYPGASTDLLYIWQPNLGLIPDNTVPNPAVSPSITTQYFVKYIDPDCLCNIMDSVLVEVLDTAHLDFDYKILCDKRTVQFINKSDTIIKSFMWMFGDQDNTSSTESNPVFTYKNFDTYTVILFTKDTTVCADTVKLILNLKDTIANFECEEECSNLLKFSFKDLTIQQYSKIKNWVWKVNDNEFDTIQNPMFMFPDTGMYTVTLIVTYDNMCMDTVNKKYIIKPLFLDIPDTVISCFGKPVELNPFGDQTYSYNWTPCNGSLDNCNSYNPTASPIFSPTYYVTVTYILPCGNECHYLDTVNVVEFNPLLVSDTVPCDKHKVLKVLNISHLDTITWKDINGNLLGTGNNFEIDIINSTEIILCVNSLYGCMLKDTFNIDKPFGLPPLEITAVPDSFCVEANTVLLNATFDQDYIYKWSPPGTLSADDIYNPIAHPTETISYFLTVSDENACIAKDSITVFEVCLCNVYLPNAFSPNDDEINDVLYVRGENFRSMELIIFNRWGQMVFKTTDQSIGWDGSHGGEKYDTDVFAFYLNVTCLNGEKYTKKGNINLIR
ncbi:MAG TPA: gliding motility-associated C-terminal domain-containing protein [Saprospiraceae bacterium]|nr:gliding motility-associated C-terminal domain-containing protein [Saprospiraceae bacterium]